MATECEGLGYELTAYVDGELAVERRQAVEAHLKTCIKCRNEVRQLEEVTSMMKNAYSSSDEPAVDLTGVWEEIESQIEFRPSIWQRLKERLQKPMVWIPTAVAATAVASLILLLPTSKRPQIGLSQVESLYSGTGQVMVLKTAKSGQPIIWILPGAGKEAG